MNGTTVVQDGWPPTAALLRGAVAVGPPSYDVVLAEHGPEMPGAGWCRACGFVYVDHLVCPAVVLAEAGFAELADRVRPVPEGAGREYGALCELTVAVERMAARLDVIGARVLASAPARKKGRRGRLWSRRAGAVLGLSRRPVAAR